MKPQVTNICTTAEFIIDNIKQAITSVIIDSLYFGLYNTDNRIIPKYHEEITNIIRRDGLSDIWSTERTVEYLLMSGLICETTWFAHKMGDWKTAYLLSVAHTSHREIAPQLYRKYVCL